MPPHSPTRPELETIARMGPTQTPIRRWRTIVTGVAEILALLSAVGFCAGIFGRWFWVFDLASHFRLQYFACFLISAIVLALFCHWRSASSCAVAAILVGITMVKYWVSANPKQPMTAPLKVISFNVNTDNERYGDVLRYLQDQSFDVVVLLEVSTQWIDQLAALHDDFPHSLIEPRNDNFGIAIFSRYPFSEKAVVPLTDYRIESLDVSISVDQRALRILATHPLPPVSGSSTAARDAQLQTLTRPPHDLPTLVIGDFNLTQFSPRFDDLLRRSGMRDTSIGHGLPPTWMRAIPVFSIPIDQAIFTPDISVLTREVGPSLGSDHNPLILSIAFAPTNPRLSGAPQESR